MEMEALSPFALMVVKIMFQSLNQYLNEIVVMIQANFKGAAVVLTTIYIIFVCYKAFFGKASKETVIEFAVSAAVLVSIVSSVIEGDFYLACVKGYVSSVLETCSWFASIGSVSNFFDIFSKLDDGFVLIYKTLWNQVPSGSFSMLTDPEDFLAYGFAILILIFSYGIMYFAFLLLIIISVFTLYILFTLGIPCVFLASFKETRHVFWAWFKEVIKFSMVMVFASITMSISYTGIDSALKIYANTTVGVEIFNSGFAAVVAWSIICWGLLLKSPDLAAALTGGTPGATTGIAAAMSIAGGGSLMAMKMGLGKTGGAAGAGLKKAGGAAYGYAKDKWLRRAGE